MAIRDGLKGAFTRVVKGVIPSIDCFRPARAKLLGQSSNRRRVDVRPDDPDLPPMTNIPLKVGVPGIEVELPGGHMIVIQWEDGRPDRPYACLWDPGTRGAVPVQATWHAEGIDLAGACDPVRDAVLTGEAIDPFTGLKHWQLGNGSRKVRAKT